jgi:hypothetical protein
LDLLFFVPEIMALAEAVVAVAVAAARLRTSIAGFSPVVDVG